jgi:L-seryl-tRNA(Ser) seleniumtransferase
MPSRLPSVDRLARTLPDELPHALRVEMARAAVGEARTRLAAGEEADPAALAAAAAAKLRSTRPTRVINATGVLLHTNLGRAPLHPAAAEAAREAATGYGNLEIDLATGGRGARGSYAESVLSAVTGAEAALAVNNNAGALFLTLAALAAPEEGRAARSVPVSRGELIEIGGSYRLPELMATSGARLVEVGTTNRTRVDDYRRAVDATTAFLLKVHTSNYRISGFTEEASLGELAGLSRERRVPLVFDAGSGLVDERVPWLHGPPPTWLSGEPGIVQSLAAGADLVLFSGDKLFGGPQAGIAVGRAELIGRLRRHPVARALRLDGPTLAALTSTAERYADGTAGELPVWRMAALSVGALERRCRDVVAAAGVEATVEAGSSTVGGGSLPDVPLPAPVIAVPGPADRFFLGLLARRPHPVVARREAGRLLVDLRTVSPELDGELADALAATCRS